VARPRFDAFIRLGSYRAPLDGLVRRAKEHAWHAALAQLGWRLGDEVHRRLQLTRDGVVVVPIPTSPWRRLRRGMTTRTNLRSVSPLVCSCRMCAHCTWADSLGRRDWDGENDCCAQVEWCCVRAPRRA
jgi:predicted amidophosphoribosyltransferase